MRLTDTVRECQSGLCNREFKGDERSDERLGVMMSCVGFCL